jgi:hypothetical protein
MREFTSQQQHACEAKLPHSVYVAVDHHCLMLSLYAFFVLQWLYSVAASSLRLS